MRDISKNETILGVSFQTGPCPTLNQVHDYSALTTTGDAVDVFTAIAILPCDSNCGGGGGGGWYETDNFRQAFLK